MPTFTPLPSEPVDLTRAARSADEERRLLVTLMAAMAEGDPAAVFTLVTELGHHLTRVVKAQLRGYGRIDLLRDPDEVAGLVLTAAFEILDRAGSWDPDGAPPWVWAGQAIQASVVRQIGHPSIELDPDATADGGRDAIGVGHAAACAVDRIGSWGERPGSSWRNGSGGPGEWDEWDGDDPSSDPRVGLLSEALGRVANRRDQHVVREYLLQTAFGDPSPSHTVADELGLSADNVRQIVSRTRRRLRTLLADDDRYRQLGESGWLAA